MMKSNLVFIPYPGIGHLRSAVEMAKLLVEQETTLSVSLLILPFVSHDEAAASAYVAAHFAASTDRLNYELITNKDQPNDEPVRVDMHVENQISKVRQAVAKLVHDKSTRLVGFVVDMFCTSMIDVANDLNVPTYLFYTSNAGALALGFHVQKLYDENKYHVITESDIENSEAELVVPFLSRPYPVKCLPSGLASEVWFQIFVNQARRFRETKGILVNTVAELEPYALESLLRCGDTPRVYPVGPMLHVEKQAHASMDEKESEILEWLDEQPAKSVVFLCFGSLGSFSEEQAREIALALERSGHSFVWSLRRASSDTLKENPKQYTNLEEVLPEGFLHRTMDRGRMIGWALQIAVLEKPAIGGFVTHCGWNSTLESLWFGVPTAAWPLYAEQKFNAFEMVEELGIAVEIKRYWKGDVLAGMAETVVTAEEIERAIKCLMEHDSDVRKRVAEMSEKCHVALSDGGSSRIALQKFIQDVKNKVISESTL